MDDETVFCPHCGTALYVGEAQYFIGKAWVGCEHCVTLRVV